MSCSVQRFDNGHQIYLLAFKRYVSFYTILFKVTDNGTSVASQKRTFSLELNNLYNVVLKTCDMVHFFKLLSMLKIGIQNVETVPALM